MFNGSVGNSSKETLLYISSSSSYDNGSTVLFVCLPDNSMCPFKVRCLGEYLDVLLWDSCCQQELQGAVEKAGLTGKVGVTPLLVPFVIKVLGSVCEGLSQKCTAVKKVNMDILSSLKDMTEVVRGHEGIGGAIHRHQKVL